MRRAIWAVWLISCGPPVTQADAEAGCAALQASNQGCFPDEIMVDCVETWLDCHGDVAVLESCPIQFACGR